MFECKISCEVNCELSYKYSSKAQGGKDNEDSFTAAVI